MTTPPSFRALSDAQLRAIIRNTLQATAGTGLRPSHGLIIELETLQRTRLVPPSMTIEELRTVWAEVERELDDEVHASRASRRAL